MADGSGLFRGDRNRNARLGRLPELVRLENTIVGIDLADKKQTVVVCDHDSKVLARRTFRYRVWDLGLALDWARAGRGEGVRRGDGVVRADRTPSAASSEQDMIKRWIHMDTHSRSWRPDRLEPASGPGARPDRPRRPMLP